MASGYEILLKGLERITNSEEFRRRSEAVIDAAFEAVFEQAAKGEIEWRRTPDGLSGRSEVSGIAKVTTANGTVYLIPVLLNLLTGHATYWSLYLYSEDGPYLSGWIPEGGERITDGHKKLLALVKTVFG